MSDIEFPAKYTVFWPGQTIHVCERHYEGIKNLSAAMGMAMPDRREEDSDQCENCVNEAAKAESEFESITV